MGAERAASVLCASKQLPLEGIAAYDQIIRAGSAR